MQMEGVRLIVNKGLSNHFQVSKVSLHSNFNEQKSEQFFSRHLYIVITLTNKIKADLVSKDQTERTADVLKVLLLL